MVPHLLRYPTDNSAAAAMVYKSEVAAVADIQKAVRPRRVANSRLGCPGAALAVPGAAKGNRVGALAMAAVPAVDRG